MTMVNVIQQLKQRMKQRAFVYCRAGPVAARGLLQLYADTSLIRMCNTRAHFALVQSEWYLGPQGQPVDLAKASEAAPAPDYVVFNGVANQYKDHPIEIGTGKRVRLFVLNAGPSVDSSFHVVGTIFDMVIKEGVRLDANNAGHYGAQAVDLSPAQGAIIEFQTAEDGLYPIVTHAFNFVGRGALGLFKSGDGDPLK